MLSCFAFIRSTLFASLGIVAVGLVSVSHAGQSNVVGGEGGAEFTIKCPKNAFIFGFDIRFGAVLDQLKPVCAKVKDGKFTDQISKPSWTGGNGGQPGGVFCPPYAGVAGLDVYVNPESLVRRFNMMCYFPGDGQVHVAASPNIGKPNFNAFAHCPPNQFVNGIVGRSGLYIDAIAVLCAELPVSSAAAPAAPAQQTDEPPEKTDGTVQVKLDVDVYDRPGDGKREIGKLAAGSIVTLVICQAEDSMCNIKGDKVPLGEGWVYSGADYNSLGL